MNALFNEFLKLLITQPGSLIYYIILSFTIAAALPTAWLYAQLHNRQHSRRVLIGLVPILLVHLIAFLLGSLVWQGAISSAHILPPLDRGMIIFSLILFIWLWAFPEPARCADITTLLLALLTITLGTINLFWWSAQMQPVPYNTTFMDKIVQGIALLLILVGEILLFIRRPAAWNFGFVMLAVLLFGHLWQLISPNLQDDYAATVRLCQLIAYPLLLTLPQRFLYKEKTLSLPSVAASFDNLKSVDEELNLPSLLSLLDVDDLTSLYREIPIWVCQNLPADYCMLIAPPDQNWQMQVLSIYDNKQKYSNGDVFINGNQVPLLATALHHSRNCNIPEHRTSSDLINLAQTLKIDRTGHLLGILIKNANQKIKLGVIVLSPYNERIWTQEDQSRLEKFAKLMAHLLQQMETHLDMTRELKQMRQSNQAIQENLWLTQQELQDLRHRPETLPPSDSESRIKETPFKLISYIQSENEELKKRLATVEKKTAITEGELHIALEEIARLRSSELKTSDNHENNTHDYSSNAHEDNLSNER